MAIKTFSKLLVYVIWHSAYSVCIVVSHFQNYNFLSERIICFPSMEKVWKASSILHSKMGMNPGCCAELAACTVTFSAIWQPGKIAN